MIKVMNIRTMVSPLLVQAMKISACKYHLPNSHCPSRREMADVVSGNEITQQTPVQSAPTISFFDAKLHALNVGYACCPGDIYMGAQISFAQLHTQNAMFFACDAKLRRPGGILLVRVQCGMAKHLLDALHGAPGRRLLRYAASISVDSLVQHCFG